MGKETNRARLSIDVPCDTRARLKAFSKDYDRSMQAVVMAALELYFEVAKKEGKIIFEDGSQIQVLLKDTGRSLTIERDGKLVTYIF